MGGGTRRTPAAASEGGASGRKKKPSKNEDEEEHEEEEAAVPEKRRRKERRAAPADTLTCGSCGVECKPDGSNWFETEEDERGITSGVGEICEDCGEYTEARNLTPAEFLKVLDNPKSKKHNTVKEERDEHLESKKDMDARLFPLVDVYKETVTGVYSEDRFGFEDCASLKVKRKHDCEDVSGVTVVKHDFPSGRDQKGIIKEAPTTTSSGSAGASSSVPEMDVDDDLNLVRYTPTRIVMREPLLKALEDGFVARS